MISLKVKKPSRYINLINNKIDDLNKLIEKIKEINIDIQTTKVKINLLILNLSKHIDFLNKINNNIKLFQHQINEFNIIKIKVQGIGRLGGKKKNKKNK